MHASMWAARSQMERSVPSSSARSLMWVASCPPRRATPRRQEANWRRPKPSRLGWGKHGMIRDAGSKLQRSGDVVIFQIRIVVQDFRARRAAREHVKDIFDSYAKPPD